MGNKMENDLFKTFGLFIGTYLIIYTLSNNSPLAGFAAFVVAWIYAWSVDSKGQAEYREARDKYKDDQIGLLEKKSEAFKILNINQINVTDESFEDLDVLLTTRSITKKFIKGLKKSLENDDSIHSAEIYVEDYISERS